MAIGTCIDLMYNKQQERLALQREFDVKIKALRAEEDELEAHVLEHLQEIQLEAGAGSLATASVKASVVPTIKDWDAFYGYIRSTGEFDLLQKRPTVSAYRERLEAGITIPGVEPFTKLEISLHKR